MLAMARGGLAGYIEIEELSALSHPILSKFFLLNFDRRQNLFRRQPTTHLPRTQLRSPSRFESLLRHMPRPLTIPVQSNPKSFEKLPQSRVNETTPAPRLLLVSAKRFQEVRRQPQPMDGVPELPRQLQSMDEVPEPPRPHQVMVTSQGVRLLLLAMDMFHELPHLRLRSTELQPTGEVRNGRHPLPLPHHHLTDMLIALGQWTATEALSTSLVRILMRHMHRITHTPSQDRTPITHIDTFK